MFSIIKNSKKRVTISLSAMLIAIVLFLMNMKFSIQFTGGLEIVVPKVENTQNLKSQLLQFIADKKYPQVNVSVGEKDDNTSILFQPTKTNDELVLTLSTTVLDYLKEIKVVQNDDDIKETSLIGASIGQYMKQSAIRSLVIGLLFMAVYILFAFSGMRKVIAPLTLAGVVILTVFFDIAIPAGAYGLLIMINPAFQIDLIFIISLLTIIGYSINDTIIIFDRIRENINLNEGALNTGKVLYGNIFETSLWQSMRRSIGTSFSTLLVIIAMFIFGTGLLKTFAFTLGVGVIAGTFSSIFLAAPLVYMMSENYKKEKNKI